jgi:DNA-binding transcriptional MerR regulator
VSVGVTEENAGRAATVPDRLLSIGTFARRSRLSMKALRIYDRLGLLTPAFIDPANGYRRYRESQLGTARLVAMLRRLDMPLAQVGEVVSAPADTAADLITAYWDAVESRVAGQRALVAQVRAEVLGARGSAAGFAIAEREVPEQLVLTAQQHLVVTGLSDFISSTARRLNTSAQAYGGRTAPLFVVYHGEVNEESDGPVEVCVPIDGSSQVSPDIATRREPTHREAYVRLRKEEVVFPQILTAFDAVHQWTHEQDRSITAAPREVYFADFLAAAPADEVCDVAFPIR